LDKQRLISLLKSIAGRDSEALRCFYREFGGTIHKTACRILKDGAAAEDILNETLYKVYEKAEFLSGLKSPAGYICVIAYNLAMDQKRKARETVGLEAISDTAEPKNGETAVLEKIFIDGILENFAEPDRSIFILKASFEYTFNEIKKALNLKELSYKQIRNKYEKTKDLFKTYYKQGNP